MLTPLATFSITTGDAYVADVQWFAPTGSVIPDAAQATLEDATTGQTLTTGKFSAVKINGQVYPVSDFFGAGLPGPAVDEREAWTKPANDPQPYTLLSDPYLGNDYWGGADYYLDYTTSGSPLGTSQDTIPDHNLQMYDGHEAAGGAGWVYSTKRLSGPATPIGANGWADKWLGCGHTDDVVTSP